MTQEYKNLPIKKKIGQLFFIGLPFEELDTESLELLEKISPGGICLFSRNTKNAEKTRKLLDDISAKSVYQPFLSLDQEGGLVDRLRRISEPMPSARDISKNGNPENAARLAKITAEMIRILGFNMNFAPVVDVTNDKRTGFIMDNQLRTFGNSAEDVFEFSSNYLETLQSSGIIGCLKHFPGIGAVEFDPHEELPTILSDRAELFEIDLQPYLEHFKKKRVQAVMTAHTTYPRFDLQETDSNGKLLPSSLSQKIVTDLLRTELGYQGLALTDDLEMGAIVNNYGIGEATKMAFLAGSDFLLICNDIRAINTGFETMLKAFETGEISESRIDESLERIFFVRQLLEKPLRFSQSRLAELSLEIKDLKKSL
jgi:beta-N-acetylhexosaminidase